MQKKFEQIMLKYGARPERTRFFPHAHDLSKFSRPYPDPKGTLGFADSKRIWITTVGRVHRENFVFDIVPIAKGVAARRSDVQFIVAGDGPHRRELEAAIRAAGLERDIYLVGYLSNDRVPLLRQAGAVSLVLVGGYALREACAAGRPIVSYDVEFHNEFIVNDETGYLIPEGDTGAAVDAILKLLDHPDRARAMGQRAQEMILARHSYEVVDPMKRKLYDELFSEARFKIVPNPAG